MMSAQPSSETVPVTVIILTLNEEYNLPGAVESVKDWAEEVFVVDSCSTDRTVDIALEHGVKIVQRPFTDFGDQWNFALEKLPIKTQWVMKLDADMRVSPKLKQEIAAVISSNPRENGFRVAARLWFMGKPTHARMDMVHLWRKEACRFSKVIVNEHALVEGTTGKLRQVIEHLDCQDLHHWFEKQNRHTTMEAIMRASGAALAAKPRFWGNVLERRMFLKRHFFSIPFRFQLLFLYNLIVCGVWRNGEEGWAWARLRTEVARSIELKTREILKTGIVPELPRAPHGDYDARVLATPLQQMLMQERER